MKPRLKRLGGADRRTTSLRCALLPCFVDRWPRPHTQSAPCTSMLASPAFKFSLWCQRGLECRYDEFGRLKKQFRGGDADRKAREEAALSRLRGSSGSGVSRAPFACRPMKSLIRASILQHLTDLLSGVLIKLAETLLALLDEHVGKHGSIMSALGHPIPVREAQKRCSILLTGMMCLPVGRAQEGPQSQPFWQEQAIVSPHHAECSTPL